MGKNKFQKAIIRISCFLNRKTILKQKKIIAYHKAIIHYSYLATKKGNAKWEEIFDKQDKYGKKYIYSLQYRYDKIVVYFYGNLSDFIYFFEGEYLRILIRKIKNKFVWNKED